MNICLVRPPVLVPNFNMTLTLTPPLGLAYVAGSLRAGGAGVQVIDGVGEGLEQSTPAAYDCRVHGLGFDEIVARIVDSPDFIGVSAQYSFEWPIYRDLIAKIRNRFPGVPIVAGGEHVTAMPERCLAESDLDYCILGEGEATAMDLASVLGGEGRGLESVDGLIWKDADGIVRNKPRKRIMDLDALAWPAWDIIPIEQYLDRNLGFGVDRGRSMPVLASRGCPYGCAFCSNRNMWGSLWRVRNPQKVLEELESYQKRYGITNFDFYDLTAVIKKEWIMEFCGEVARREMIFTWQLPSGTRSEALDGESAAAMYQSGCRNLSFSPESGSPDMLRLIEKKISLDKMLTAIRQCVGAGLNIKTNIIFGFPGETYRHIRESFAYIARMAAAGAHDLSIWAFSPYPGSKLFDQLTLQGRIVIDEKFYYSLRSYADVSKTVSFSDDISDSALKRLRIAGTLWFYLISFLLRPWRVAKLIANVIAGRQESRFEMAIVATLRRLSQRKSARAAGSGDCCAKPAERRQ